MFKQGKNVANTGVLASILTKSERKSAFLRRSSDISLYPTVEELQLSGKISDLDAMRSKELRDYAIDKKNE